jgi:predicted ATPase
MNIKNQDLTLRIENFRSIRKTDLTLRAGVNILIGPNGSGKTCLLAALKFLRDVFAEGVGLAMAKSGGPLRNYHRGENTIRFSVDHYYGIRVYRRKQMPHRFTWSLSIAQSGPEQIATIVEENFVVYVHDGDQDVNVLSVTADRTNHTQPIVTHKLASKRYLGKNVFSQLNQSSRDSKDEILDRVSKLLNTVTTEFKAYGDRSFLPDIAHIDTTLFQLVTRFINLNEYNILPDVARQATDQIPFAEISPNGGGLSEVIHALISKHYQRLTSAREYASARYWFPGTIAKDSSMSIRPYLRSRVRRMGPRALDEILEKINHELSLAVRSISGISTGVDPTNGKRFVLFESGNEKFYPEEVSDGTIKWLSILVSIFVPYSTIYMLEEPENFLHPWMQQQLIRTMREQARPNAAIFILTTHSATVLNAASAEEITLVSRDDAGTHTERLESRELLASMLEQSNFGLGDLWVSGLIGGVPAGSE